MAGLHCRFSLACVSGIQFDNQGLISKFFGESVHRADGSGAEHDLVTLPALLTTTSRPPRSAWASATAASAAPGSVTSRGAVRNRPRCSSDGCLMSSGWRAVASTASPLSKTAVTSSAPKPRDDPVISQTFRPSFTAGMRSFGVRPAGPLCHPGPRTFVVQTTAYAILRALNHLVGLRDHPSTVPAPCQSNQLVVVSWACRGTHRTRGGACWRPQSWSSACTASLAHG